MKNDFLRGRTLNTYDVCHYFVVDGLQSRNHAVQFLLRLTLRRESGRGYSQDNQTKCDGLQISWKRKPMVEHQLTVLRVSRVYWARPTTSINGVSGKRP